MDEAPPVSSSFNAASIFLEVDEPGAATAPDADPPEKPVVVVACAVP